MTTPTETIKASDIRNEFGASGPNNSVSLGNYRVKQTVSGLNDLPLDTGVPLPDSQISFGNLRGKKLNIVVDTTVNTNSYQTISASSLNGTATVSFSIPSIVPPYIPFIDGQWVTVSGIVPTQFNGNFRITKFTTTPNQPTQITSTYTSDTTITLPSDATNISITVTGASGGTGGNDSGGTGGNGANGRVGTFTLPNGGRTLQFKIGGVGGDGGNYYQSPNSGGGTPGTSNVSAGGRGGNAGGHGSSGTGGGGGGATGVYDSVTSSYIIVAGGGAGGGGGSINRGGTPGSVGKDWSSSSGSFSIAAGKQGADKGPSPADGGGGGGGGGGAIGGNGGSAGNDGSLSATGGIGGESKYNSSVATYTANSSSTHSGSGSVSITYTTYTYVGTVQYGLSGNYGPQTQIGTITGGPASKVNAKSRYDNNTSITYIGNFASKPASTAGKRVIIHTNGPIGSDKTSSTRTYCSLLTGSWDPAADLYIDIGPNAKIYGAGGDGGKGADVYQPNGGSQITGATNGGPGTSALGIILTNNTIINNRGSIVSGNGGGGGGGGAAARTKRRGKDDNTACGGGGGGGGAGYPGGAGGKGGVASHVENGDTLSGQDGEGGSLTSGGNGGAGYYSESGGRAAAGGGGGGAPGGLGGDAIEELSYPIYDENGEVIGYDVIDTGARKGSKASSTSGKGGDGSGTNGSSSGANGGSNGYAIVVNGSMPNITGNGTITGDKLPNTNPT